MGCGIDLVLYNSLLILCCWTKLKVTRFRQSNILIQQVSQLVSQSQGYTQLTADGPSTSVNKTQMIESNCGPSGWSSCSANVFFLLSSPAYVSSPSLVRALSRSLSSHGHNSLQNSTDLTSSFRVFVVFVFCCGFQEQEFVCCTFAAGCSESSCQV
jgi:hypothetical protein